MDFPNGMGRLDVNLRAKNGKMLTFHTLDRYDMVGTFNTFSLKENIFFTEIFFSFTEIIFFLLKSFFLLLKIYFFS